MGTSRVNYTVLSSVVFRHARHRFFTGFKVVDWLSDLSWVPNGAVILISSVGDGGGKRAGAQNSSSAKAATAPGSAAVRAGNDHHAPEMGGGAGEGEDDVQGDEEEEQEEALALAAISRIRESYKARAKARQSGAGRRGGEISIEEAGKRLAEKRHGLEGTPAFREASAAAWTRSA